MTLRKKLDALNVNVFEHIQAVADLKKNFNHSIKPIESKVWLPSYTCLVFALRFAGDATYSSAIKKANRKGCFAGKEFFDWLVTNNHLIQIDDGSRSVGDFIVYFNSYDEFKHIGILSDENRVKSKWGELGLYDHEIFDVPENYGDDVKFFKPIKYDIAIAAFKQFASEIA